jgi:large subunit ribosomal protein L5e
MSAKNSSYFSRFQVRFRRRRTGKTDYAQRRRLVQQDKTKPGVHKHRLVARITSTKVIAQIIYPEVDHDVTICQATSRDLSVFGITLGLTNYASAYCVGLLVARRVLKKLGMDTVFTKAIAGKDPESVKGQPPFQAILDIGLRRATTGARVFAVMKGAADGGLFIPHNDDRLAGSTTKAKSKKKKKGDEDEGTTAKGKGKGAAPKPAPKPAAAARKAADKPAAGKAAAAEKGGAVTPGTTLYFILGGHVADYMRQLQSDPQKPGAYERQFSRYIKAGITADMIQGLYLEAHKQIRANPDRKPPGVERYKPKKPRTQKLSAEVRRAKLNERLEAAGLGLVK